MSYLQKLTPTNCFNFKNAVSFSNLSQIEDLEQVQEENPDYIIKLKKVYIDSLEDTTRNDHAKVLFLVDVSGSVGLAEKEHFAGIQEGIISSLTKDYTVVNHGVILHHTSARSAVTGYSWIEDNETGGTIVSTAYEEAKKHLSDSYDLYIVQLTDGDNWADDTSTTNNIVNELAISGVRGFKYFEISGRSTQSLHTSMMKNKCVEVFRMATGSLELRKD